MGARREELEEFKSSVNLTEYAASCGYELDRKASSPNSALMRGPGGDKIIVAKGIDGHFVYFSVGDADDNTGWTAGRGPRRLLALRMFLDKHSAILLERQLKRSRFDKRNWLARLERLDVLRERHAIPA